MSQGLPDLTETEQRLLDQLSAHIVDTRQQRVERIQACIETLRHADDVTRLLARTCVEHYINESPPEDAFTRPSAFNRDTVQCHAPGLFAVFGSLNSKLMETGEFISVSELINSAASLGFKEEKGVIAAEFLYQWLAAQYPDSEAARTVNFLGLRSGRMSHNIHGKGDFQTPYVLFHKTATQSYVDAINDVSYEPRTGIDPIIYLAVTDDWEGATSFMTPHQRQRLGS